MKKQLPGWAVLLIITLVAGLALGGTYALTKDPIAEQARVTAENARKAALPDAEEFQALTLNEGAPVDWVYAGLATVKGVSMPVTLEEIDALSGATYTSTAVVNALNDAYAQYQASPSDQAFTAEAQGFAGPVAVKATFDGDAITSLTIGDERFSETEGFGARALEEGFQSQFVTGSKAVGYVAQTTVNGFGGEVEVIAGVDTSDVTNLTLGGISVGGSNFSETAGLGARSKEAAFTDQFVGKVTPVKFIKAGEEAGDNTIDALTSATITTTAVVNGVNNIVKYVKADILGISGAEMPARPDDSLVFSSSAKGFRGPVYVEAAFDGNQQVTYLSVGDEEFAEDIGAGVKEADFMYQFIGKTVPLTISDIEAISGATISSTAVVTALNQAYELSTGAEIAVPETPTLPEKPAEGVYSASEQGFAGPVYVEAAFDAEGKVSYIGVGDDQFAETAGFGARALDAEEQVKFIGKQMPLTLEDVDALTGATFTKTAIVTALNKAYNASQGIVEEEPAEQPKAEEPAVAEAAGNTVQASGLTGKFDVTVSLNDDGTVKAVTLGESDSDMDKTFLALANTDAFLGQFVGKALPVSDVDIAAGATVSSNAIIDAVNSFAAPAVEEPAAEEPAAEEPTAEEPAVEEPAAEEPAAEEPTAEEPTVEEPAAEEPAVEEPVIEEPAAEEPAAEEPTREAPQEGPQAEAGFEGEVIAFFSSIKADAAFEGNKISSLSLAEKAVGGEAYAPSALEAAFQAALIGAEVPVDAASLDVDAPEYVKAAVALAVNQAYAQAQKDAEAPSAEIKKEGYTGETVIFFSAIRADVAFEESKITSLVLSEKAVGGETYAPSDLEAAFRAALVGVEAPVNAAALDVDAPEYVKAAVTLAVNQAYAQAQGAKKAVADQETWYTGEAVVFFTEIRADASFEDQMIVDLRLWTRAVGTGEYAPMAREDAYRQALIGQSVPLEKADVDGEKEYILAAVAIAVNQAYEQSLAGQQ